MHVCWKGPTKFVGPSPVKGENYQTGIITNKDLISYCSAIKEIMENESLYQHLSLGAQTYVKNHFSNTAQNYLLKYYES